MAWRGHAPWILDQLDAERSRWMLWLPVAMGLGIAVYFELPGEPALWLGPALAAAALVLVFLAPAGSLARALAIDICVYVAQVMISAQWLKHYRFGPIEWLWRSLMYGMPQRFRR